MDYQELAKESFTTLTLNRVRTSLAMLGVIIGIGSVITLMSLGQSSQKSIQDQIKSLGSNLLTVSPGAQTSGGIRGSSGGTTTLTYADAQAIESSSQLTLIETVAPLYQKNAQLTSGRNNTNTQVIGVTSPFAQVRNIKLTTGSFITDAHVAGLSKVAVIGPQTAIDLFGEEVSPIGKTLRIEGQSFTIIGETESKGGSGFSNEDDQIIIPLTTSQKLLFGTNYLSSIYIEAVSENDMDAARDEIGYFLLQRHRISDPLEADFSIMSQEDLLGTVSEVTGTFTILLSGIAAISLLVGGIGIMNIMLVTVTERTREIGLRKALGAKKKWITTQFLFEAIIITFTGGAIGVTIGTVASYLIASFMNLPPVISIPSILLAFGVSVIIGIVFGWYPAKKAANLAPIEALRYE